MNWIIFIIGFSFGAILQYANLNKYNTISGMAILKDYTVAKTIATAIGLGAILIAVQVDLGLASYHIKPLFVGSIIVGGVLFGIGMAILGYCPGTLPISLGQGSVDALFGILGGLFAGIIYTVLSSTFHQSLGPDLGKISLYTAIGNHSLLFYGVTLVISVALVGLSFWLNKLEKGKDLRWFFSGLGLAVLACFVFASSITDRVIGVSSFYPYMGNIIIQNTDNIYFQNIAAKSGTWDKFFLLGAFISGIVISLLRKDFKIKVVYENWSRYKGSSVIKRLIWAFLGGFLLLFGARMAGGCTSGHVISGGMQLAASSMLFAFFVFASFLATGKMFYRKR